MLEISKLNHMPVYGAFYAYFALQPDELGLVKADG